MGNLCDYPPPPPTMPNTDRNHCPQQLNNQYPSQYTRSILLQSTNIARVMPRAIIKSSTSRYDLAQTGHRAVHYRDTLSRDILQTISRDTVFSPLK